MKPFLVAIVIFAMGFAVRSSAAATGAGYLPTDAERARWTMSDMRSLATALEAYAKDHKGAYPAVATMADVVPLVQPSYMRKAHATDAWGQPYVFVPGAGGQVYKLVSVGSDGKPDETTWGAAGPLKGFEEDAVLDSGSMTRPWPFR